MELNVAEFITLECSEATYGFHNYKFMINTIVKIRAGAGLATM